MKKKIIFKSKYFYIWIFFCNFVAVLIVCVHTACAKLKMIK